MRRQSSSLDKRPTAAPDAPLREHLRRDFERASDLWDQGDRRNAFRIFLSAADRGDASAQLNVGYFYDAGIGTRRNQDEAVRWYRRAYLNGEASGAHNLATVLRDRGERRRAIAWFKRSIAMGNDSSALELAGMYVGQPRGQAIAVRYLQQVIRSRRVSEEDVNQARTLLRVIRAR
jgi:TPR repeat protein